MTEKPQRKKPGPKEFNVRLSEFREYQEKLAGDLADIRMAIADLRNPLPAAADRGLPEIDPNDDTWLLDYEIFPLQPAQDEEMSIAHRNGEIAAQAKDNDVAERLCSLVRVERWPHVIVLAFIVEEKLGTLDLHWEQGAETSEGKPRIIKWAALAGFCQTYTAQNGYQSPIRTVANIVRELLQARALYVRERRVVVNEALRRLLMTN